MEQLSLRGFDKQLEKRIRETARRERLSLNKAALLLMRRGAGLVEAPDGAATVGSTLDEFIGKWSVKQERQVLDSIAAFETVDESLWA